VTGGYSYRQGERKKVKVYKGARTRKFCEAYCEEGSQEDTPQASEPRARMRIERNGYMVVRTVTHIFGEEKRTPAEGDIGRNRDQYQL